MPLQFLHFDSSQRSNINSDPFNASFTLSNSIRNIKKIYLKSCEIPCGYYNIRTPQIFSFILNPPSSSTLTGSIQPASMSYIPIQTNNFGLVVNDSNNAYSGFNPILVSLLGNNNIFHTQNIKVNNYPIQINITVPIGNYTIDSLINYINSCITNLYIIYKNQYDAFAATCPTLSKVLVAASSSFPVGYIQLNVLSGVNIQILPSTLNSMLGFINNQSSTTTIIGPNFYNLYPDISIYLYFPTIPHNNTHFSNQLISFKIPVTVGYQAIEFNQENINFAQYIEVSDKTFILTNIQLLFYDRLGNVLLNNNLDYTMTLGIETE
jgi:hypothetical protein